MIQLKSAVIGAGFVGRAHIEALRRLGVPIMGLLGSSPERGEATRALLRLPRAYRSLQELAEDPEVHVVHICTPNHLHFEQASVLLRAGKHVMCEKPLAMDSRQSAALLELAQSSQRVGGVTYKPPLLSALPGSPGAYQTRRYRRAPPSTRRLSSGLALACASEWSEYAQILPR